MKKNFNPDVHHRRSVRLKGFDYSQKGNYFITICSALKELIFGKIQNCEVILNPLGKLIEKQLLKTEDIRTNVKIDSYVIMPNHLHVIISISDKKDKNIIEIERFSRPVKNSIPTIVRLFKSSVTRAAGELNGFNLISIWQKGYYEHVIKNNTELKYIREYIKRNPELWADDEYFIQNR